MYSKRLTPQSKSQPRGPPSASKYRSPGALNLTVLDRRDSGLRFGRSSSYADLSSIGHNSTVHPNIRRNVLEPVTPSVDYEFNCDLGYNDYLQALLKKEIQENAIQKYEEEWNDQLVVQKDNLYNGKLALKKQNQEIEELEKLEKIHKLITVVSNNFAQFSQLCEDFDFKESLKQLLEVLKLLCNRISVKNIKPLKEQEDMEKLNIVLEQCVESLKKMNLKERNIEEINSLATVMTKYKEVLQIVTQKQNFIHNAKNNETYKLLKKMSNMFAGREKYGNDIQTLS